MDPIKTYTKEVLAPRLDAYGASKDQRVTVLADVELRLLSLLWHWRDVPFRRTILLLGEEEGTFWEPSTASLEVRSLVVMGVRNSLIESLHAEVRQRRPLIDDEQMALLTGEAINYFHNAALTQAARRPPFDKFGTLRIRFPNAWQALSVLANSSYDDQPYRLNKQEAEPISALSSSTRVSGRAVVVAGGMDLRLDTFLAESMADIRAGKAEGIITPSFARLSRNPAKLLSVMDHVLRHDCTFATANYAFSTRYVARRRPLLRPPHNIDDVVANETNMSGLSAWHKELLGFE